MKKYLKFLDTILGFFAFANIILASYESELFFDNGNKSNQLTNTCRIIIMIISFCLCFLVVGDYMLRLQIDKLEMKRP
jgi:hypothetical protein